MKLNRGREGGDLRAGPGRRTWDYVHMHGKLKNSPQDGVYTVQAHTISSRAEVGVLNRNIASSADVAT